MPLLTHDVKMTHKCVTTRGHKKNMIAFLVNIVQSEFFSQKMRYSHFIYITLIFCESKNRVVDIENMILTVKCRKNEN